MPKTAQNFKKNLKNANKRENCEKIHLLENDIPIDDPPGHTEPVPLDVRDQKAQE